MRILRILSGAVLAVALVLPVTATEAFAHVALVSSNPKDGAKLDEAPKSAKLTFSETLDAPSTKVAVTKGEGEPVDGPKPEISGDTITQPLRLPEKGRYTVAFHIVSEDGHPVRDSISFDVASVPEENRTTSSAPGKSEASADGDSASETAGQGSSSIGWGVVAAIAAGVAVLVVAVVILVRRRSRHS
ncbi:MAG: copper resistance CopC family protein [Stackebrandtia sp.]